MTAPSALITPLRLRIAFPLAIVCGVLYFAAFPGIDVWPLSFCALTPLVVAIRGQSPKHALLLGWAAGFTMTIIGFSWLLDMLRTFSGFPVPLCALFMAILCAYQAGRIALLGWLCARAEKRGWPFTACFAVGFAASEQLFPLLFPWYYGATVHQVPALAQVAEIGGPIAIALTLVAFNLALAEPIFAWREGRKPRYLRMAALAAIPALSAVYGAIRIPMVDAAIARAEPLRVGLVQANMSLFGKRHNLQEGLQRHQRLTRSISSKKAGKHLDLAVWSETSVAGPVAESYANDFYPQLFTRRLKVPTIFGAVLVRKVPDEREYVHFNSALISDDDGKIVGRYDKHLLLGFGEYLPLGDTFPILYRWSPNTGHFTPGTTEEPLTFRGRKIATFICYEDIVPGFVNRIMQHDSPGLLVNLTNDAWFGDTTEPWIHLALAKLRAVEQRRFFVRSTNSGVSAFVDPVGRVMSHTQTFEEEAQAQDVRWMDGTTVYRIIGDIPWWLLTVVSLIGCFVRRPRTKGALEAAEPSPQEPSAEGLASTPPATSELLAAGPLSSPAATHSPGIPPATEAPTQTREMSGDRGSDPPPFPAIESEDADELTPKPR